MSSVSQQKTEKEICREEQGMLNKEKEERDSTKGSIINEFWNVLDGQLSKLEMYHGHSVARYKAQEQYCFEEIASELGFNVELKLGNAEEKHEQYFLTIPEIKEGDELTKAQQDLLKFKQRLAKAQTEKKAEIFSECERVRKLMANGEYVYSPGEKKNSAKIFLESKMKIQNEYEKQLVRDFFSNLKFKFAKSSNGKWEFIY